MTLQQISAVAFSCLMLLSCLSCGKSCEEKLTAQDAVLPIGYLDTPKMGETVKGTATLAGWGAHESGISVVALYLDGHYLTNATTGVDRPDVQKVLPPQFHPSMIAGYNGTVDLSKVGAGDHELTAKVLSKAGTDRDFSVHVNVSK
jgi:N-acetylmuramoyl-L-alanine amidase